MLTVYIIHTCVPRVAGLYLSTFHNAEKLEYFFVHGINDAGTLVGRAKLVDDVPRTYVGSLQHGLHELQFPGSVSTEGWNINQDGSIVGHYDSAEWAQTRVYRQTRCQGRERLFWQHLHRHAV